MGFKSTWDDGVSKAKGAVDYVFGAEKADMGIAQQGYDPNADAFGLSGGWTHGEDDQIGASIYEGYESAQNREAGADMTGATIARGEDQQARAQQMKLGQTLWDRQQGNAPSLANMQLEQSRQANISASQAQAASMAGVNPALALKMSQQSQTDSNIAASQQGAQMRAQEQAAAEQALGGLYSDVRSQDIGVATGQAGLAQQTAEANMQKDIQYQQMNDDLTMKYLNVGMTREQAQMQAAMDLEKLKAQDEADKRAAAVELEKANLDAASKQKAANLGFVGTVIDTANPFG